MVKNISFYIIRVGQAGVNTNEKTIIPLPLNEQIIIVSRVDKTLKLIHN